MPISGGEKTDESGFHLACHPVTYPDFARKHTYAYAYGTSDICAAAFVFHLLLAGMHRDSRVKTKMKP